MRLPDVLRKLREEVDKPKSVSSLSVLQGMMKARRDTFLRELTQKTPDFKQGNGMSLQLSKAVEAGI